MDKVPTPSHTPTAGCNRRSGGFTLVEVVIAIVLLGILAAVGSTMIADTATTTRIINSNLASLSQARYAVERLEREIREIRFTGGAYSITSMGTDNFVFTKSDGVMVTIDRTATNLTLAYAPPGTTATLTDQVDTAATPPFQLRYFDITDTETTDTAAIRYVQITLNVRNTTTGTVSAQRSRVALRNTQ